MSHKKFMEKFKETISRKHNKVIDDDAIVYENTTMGVVGIPNEMIEKVMKEMKHPSYSNPHTRRINYGAFSTLSHETDKEVQAIIDILSDPLILRYRGYK